MEKRIKTVILKIVLLFSTIIITFLKCFTGVLGKPIFILVDNHSGKSIVKTSSLVNIDLVDPSQFTLSNLKYCSNLQTLCLITHSEYENLNFIGDLKITSFYFSGECKDWSKLNELIHLKTLSISYSNFDDLSLIKDMNNLEELTIQTTSVVDFSEIIELHKLSEISIDVGNTDISDISKLTQINTLDIFRCSNLDNIDFLKSMDNIQVLSLDRLCIDDYFALTQMKKLKCVKLFKIYTDDFTFLLKIKNLEEIQVFPEDLLPNDILSELEKNYIDVSPL